MPDDILQTWIKKLQEQGKTQEEIGKILAGVSSLSSLEVYTAIMDSLTDEDAQEVEKIEDEALAQKRIEELFKQRTGMTVTELVTKIQDAFAKEHASSMNISS